MKKLVLTAIGIMVAGSVWAQGTVNFSNLLGLSARITDVDGTTFLAGSAYKVDLFYGAVGADPSTFTSLNLAVNFNTGGQAGFFAGGEQSLPIAGGTAVQIQPRAWRASDGATWQDAWNAMGNASDAATATIVTVTLADGTASPKPTPPSMTGYVGHSIVVAPEPSTILLGLAGLGGLLFLRRKVS
jgi:hypothetical protein